MNSNLLNTYYLKKKIYHLLTIKKFDMDSNKKNTDQGYETGSQDQYDHHQKTDNRQRDTLGEHQNSTRKANPQTENGRKNMKSDAKPGTNIPKK